MGRVIEQNNNKRDFGFRLSLKGMRKKNGPSKLFAYLGLGL
jgi:hypothetical protein